MNDRFDIDLRMTQWLTEEAVARAPERLVHATRERIASTPQTGSLRKLIWRFPAVTSKQGVLTAALVAGVLLTVASQALNQSSRSVGAPTPNASASPSPSASLPPAPSPYPCGQGAGTCLGQLQPGTYQTQGFRPQFSYTVQAGWLNDLDVHGLLVLLSASGGQYAYPDGTTFRDGIYVYRRPIAASATSRTPVKGIATTARALADWLSGHVGLDASSVTPVRIGGARGYRVDIALPKGARTAPDRCTGDHGEARCASLFLSDDPAATPGGPDWFDFGIVGPETAVVYLIDAPSGDTVMVVIDDVDGIDRNGLIAAAAPFVNSLVFAQ